MHPFNLPTQSVVYVMDAYCGWCWGFAERMREFEEANRDRVAFTAISGGLFIGERAKAISAYPHIPEANKRITEMTGAGFSDAYQAVLHQGTMMMNSLDAAAGLAVLRAQAPQQAVHWAHELQAAFYGQGLSLSDPDTIVSIAKANGLDDVAVRNDLDNGDGQKQAQADFALARALGTTSFPTLLYINGNQVYQLPATGTPLNTLNQKLDELLG